MFGLGIVWTVGIVGFVLVVIIFMGVVIFTKKSYRNPCFVADRVGESFKDVIWSPDKFKTRRRGEHLEVMFEKHRGKCYPPPQGGWSRFWTSKKNLPQNDEDWSKLDDPDLRKHLTRGAFFVRVSDSEYKVAQLNDSGNFEVVDNDSRELIVDDIERERQITTSFKDKLLQVGMWLGSLIIIGAIGVAVFVLSIKYAGEQSEAIITLARQAIDQAPGIGG
jgi:hypothetical protein